MKQRKKPPGPDDFALHPPGSCGPGGVGVRGRKAGGEVCESATLRLGRILFGFQRLLATVVAALG